MPNQDPPFFVITESVRLLGPFPDATAAERVSLDFMLEAGNSEDGVCSIVMSAAELAILRDRLSMMELRS